MGSPAFETSKPDAVCAHCMASTERLLRYINNNAYVVVIAIGEDFRSASTTVSVATTNDSYASRLGYERGARQQVEFLLAEHCGEVRLLHVQVLRSHHMRIRYRLHSSGRLGPQLRDEQSLH